MMNECSRYTPSGKVSAHESCAVSVVERLPYGCIPPLETSFPRHLTHQRLVGMCRRGKFGTIFPQATLQGNGFLGGGASIPF